ncbi:MAG: CoA transferase [Actinomycetota bacterium]
MAPQSGLDPAPLAGMRVIDLGQVLASPFASYLLGVLGAEVIKVEPPEGEWLRLATGGGLGFAAQNAGKQMVAIDVSTDAGAAIVRRMASDADVFVEGFAPGVADRLGVGFDAISTVNDRIVYGSLSAFGDSGPYANRPGFDHVVQAVSGIMPATGFVDSPPTKVGSPYVDYGSGMLLAFALLAGILERNRTERAVRVDVTMLDAALMLNIGAVVRAAAGAGDPPRTGNDAFSGAAASGAFETADGLLMVAANKVSHFVRFCDELGLDSLADDTSLAMPGADTEVVDAARARMSAVLMTDTAVAWERRLVARRVPAAAVRSVSEVVGEGHAEARGLLQAPSDGSSSALLPGAGIAIDGAMPGARGQANGLGADTQAVLGHLGYSPGEIDDLVDQGVVVTSGR